MSDPRCRSVSAFEHPVLFGIGIAPEVDAHLQRAIHERLKAIEVGECAHG